MCYFCLPSIHSPYFGSTPQISFSKTHSLLSVQLDETDFTQVLGVGPRPDLANRMTVLCEWFRDGHVS